MELVNHEIAVIDGFFCLNQKTILYLMPIMLFFHYSILVSIFICYWSFTVRNVNHFFNSLYVATKIKSSSYCFQIIQWLTTIPVKILGIEFQQLFIWYCLLLDMIPVELIENKHIICFIKIPEGHSINISSSG